MEFTRDTRARGVYSRGRHGNRDATGVGRKCTVCEVPEVTGTWRRRGKGTEVGHNLKWAAAGFALGKEALEPGSAGGQEGVLGEEPASGAQAGRCLESGWP